MNYAAELALALELADIADAVSMPYFRNVNLRVDRKADRTEVTQADRETEAAIRAHLSAHRPSHAVLGEEDGLVGSPDARYKWIIDPIDGTSNFVKGVPIWATLIALEADGELAVGVASSPALGRRWWAARGLGAYADGNPIHVSSISSLGEAHLSHAGVALFDSFGSPERCDALVKLTKEVWRERGLGDFWMHVLVAEGAFDIAVESVVNTWDLAALLVIVEEAGGTFTDLRGRRRADGGSALSTNGHLHAAVLARLGLPDE